jgi:hypothetical protein
MVISLGSITKGATGRPDMHNDAITAESTLPESENTPLSTTPREKTTMLSPEMETAWTESPLKKLWETLPLRVYPLPPHEMFNSREIETNGNIRILDIFIRFCCGEIHMANLAQKQTRQKCSFLIKH